MNWKRALCFFWIHWSGQSNRGMWGDAASCDICKADANGGIGWIVHDRALK